jgi:hypothetical protein
MLEKYNTLMELVLPDTPVGLHNITKQKFKQFLNKSKLHLDPLTYSLICSRNNTNNTDILYEIRFNYDLNLDISKNVKTVLTNFKYILVMKIKSQYMKNMIFMFCHFYGIPQVVKQEEKIVIKN